MNCETSFKIMYSKSCISVFYVKRYPSFSLFWAYFDKIYTNFVHDGHFEPRFHFQYRKFLSITWFRFNFTREALFSYKICIVIVNCVSLIAIHEHEYTGRTKNNRIGDLGIVYALMLSGREVIIARSNHVKTTKGFMSCL